MNQQTLETVETFQRLCRGWAEQLRGGQTIDQIPLSRRQLIWEMEQVAGLPAITDEKLLTIELLYRQEDTLSLWGIPYQMRNGQQPADIKRAHLLPEHWIWLGTPGWYGNYTRVDQRKINEWLAQFPGLVPEGPNEWSVLFTRTEYSVAAYCECGERNLYRLNRILGYNPYESATGTCGGCGCEVHIEPQEPPEDEG